MFHCPDCGEIDHVLVNGYPIGDRLLEGVMFEIRRAGGKLTVKVEDRSKDYFKTLDQKYWLKLVLEQAENRAVCPKCQEDIDEPIFDEDSEEED